MGRVGVSVVLLDDVRADMKASVISKVCGESAYILLYYLQAGQSIQVAQREEEEHGTPPT